MKKILALICIIVASSHLQAQSLSDVLKDYFKATGQNKLSKVDAVVTTGKIKQMGVEIPFTQYAMRPYNYRVEGTFQGMSFVQTFNGSEGWMLNPFAGDTLPQAVPADQIKSLKRQADIDGLLWNWEEKGFAVTLDSIENVEGISCHKVDIITAEGDTYTYYIDTKEHLLIRSSSKPVIMGAPVESDTYYSNYLFVNDIAFPGIVINKYNGVVGEEIIVDKVEIDKQLDPLLFERPGGK